MAGRHDRARAREPRSPPRRAAARRAGPRRRGRSGSSSTPPPRSDAARRDRRLARRGGARHRLPGDLAARRRLRDPRPLHGLPHDPAPARVHRRGGGDAGLRPRARARPRRSTTSGSCARSTGSPTRSPSPSWRSGRPAPPSGPGGRSRAGTAPRAESGAPFAAPRSGRRPGHDLGPQPPPALRLRAGPLRRRRSPPAASTPRPSSPSGSASAAAHLITGHTHRGGPGENEGEWPLRGGGSLHNTGSWIFASAFHHPGTPPGPYWPGTVTWVEDDEPPRRVRLLADHPRDELAEVVRRQRSRPEP